MITHSHFFILGAVTWKDICYPMHILATMKQASRNSTSESIRPAKASRAVNATSDFLASTGFFHTFTHGLYGLYEKSI